MTNFGYKAKADFFFVKMLQLRSDFLHTLDDSAQNPEKVVKSEKHGFFLPQFRKKIGKLQLAKKFLPFVSM